ncbi:MAG: zinc ribbon domain-containing protein [Oligosphaeraceae bacterium]
MQEWKEKLLALQENDLTRDSLRREREELNVQWKRLSQAFLARQEEVAGVQRLAVSARERCRALEEEGLKLAKERHQFQVKTAEIRKNDEYQMAMETLERYRLRLQENEERQLLALEEAEKAEKDFLQEKERLQQERKTLEEQKLSLGRKARNLGEELAKREGERAALAEQVPLEVRRLYEHLLSGRQQGALRPWAVSVEQGVCQRCRRAVTPHKIQELNRDKTLQTCDHCGAILLEELS